MQFKLNGGKRILALICLLLAGIIGVTGLCVQLHTTTVKPLTLLSEQTYHIQEKGLIFAAKDNSGSATFDRKSRSLTGVSEGKDRFWVVNGLHTTSYEVSTYIPGEQTVSQLEMTVGETQQPDTQDKPIDVTWFTTDSSVAEVSEDGTIIAHKAGSCEITELLNHSKTYTYHVEVPEPALTREYYRVYTGETIELPVEDCQTEVEWDSDSDSVEVNKDGTVTTKEVGEAHVTTEVGGENLTADIKVMEDPVVEEELDLSLSDEATHLQVENIVEQPEYSSSDETVATVDEWGKVTPVGEGTAEIEISVREKTLSTTVTVHSPEEDFQKINYGDYQPETSMGALTLIGMCEYYNDTMRSDKDNWYNSNKTKISRVNTFDEMIKAEVKGANCNNLTNWAMIDMGVYAPGNGIYGDANHEIHNYNDGNGKLKEEIDAACEVISTGGKSLKSLISSGELQPGDMLFGKLHTLIYRGDSTVFASAGDSKHHSDSKGMVFDNWVCQAKETYNWKKDFYYIIRFKEDYVPRYYRDKDGELQENPIYLAAQEADEAEKDTEAE